MHPQGAHDPPQHPRRRLARLVLTVFLLTFLLARIIVLLIMTRRMPDLFLYVGGTHVHHLNYGIFLLAACGAWLLFAPPSGHAATVVAVAYAVGLALTFDEFGMWLHLGGSYWQRASVDAVIVVAALLALVAFGRSVRHFELRHFRLFLLLLLALVAFAWVLFMTGNRLGNAMGPTLQALEEASSP